MKKFIVLLMFLATSCSSPEVRNVTIEHKPFAPEKFLCSPLCFEPAEVNIDLTGLEKFFKMTEDDANRAVAVVEKDNLVLNLSHLKAMNTGGKKYYLLEKENITNMINAVTAGIYIDYILINKSGDVIYTRKNEEIFGDNINKGYENSPLRKCFYSRDGVHFEDVSVMTTASNILGLYVSVPVKLEGEYQGTLILQIDISVINRLFDESTDIMSREGVIRVAYDRKRVLSKYPPFGEIDMVSLDRDKKWSSTTDSRMNYSLFNYRNISWIIAKKQI